MLGYWNLVLTLGIFYYIAKCIEGDLTSTTYGDGFDKTNVRLPNSLRPSLYNISLTFPNISAPNETGTMWFACTTVITLTCYEDTDLIRFHTIHHDIKHIQLLHVNTDGDDDGDDGEIQLDDFTLNKAMETIDIHPGFTLRNGSTYKVSISTESEFSNLMTGIYYSPYIENGVTSYIITTMFEPTSARLLFPCFDEPDFKAVYLLNIKRVEEITCVSNLPLRTTLGPYADGLYEDVFDEPQSVPMSTYLVAFACGDIDYLESEIDGIQFRTYSRSSMVNLTQYSLDIGLKTLKYFQDYFEVPYPLPKEDMIAVPTMAFNAMEHWGMITYREDAMLFEEGVSSEEDREWAVILISHEISHQWFGNLVSPRWWDDLWLNEGFATYMMFLGAERILPGSNMMKKLLVDYRGIHSALEADDSLSSHPVYVPVYHPNEINEIFDLISYAKGCAVIRMMHFFLGEDTFRDGLVMYLRDFTYKTATHNDLWASLEKQAVLDNATVFNIKSIMDTWLLEKNYPVVMVTKVNDDQLTVSQSAFLIDSEEREQRKNIFWEIPFTYTTSKELTFQKSPDDITWLHKDGQNVTIMDNGLSNASWYIGNVLQHGFYRVNYPRENWMALVDQLQTDPFVIHPSNRAQIINDVWNLARAGLTDVSIALQCMQYLDKETDYVPWRAALTELEFVETALQLTQHYGLFEDFMRSKLQMAYLSSKGANTTYDIIHYSMITEAACRYGLQECIDDVITIFDQWKKGEITRVDPNIKATVYCTGVKNGGRAAWEHVVHAYQTTESKTEQYALVKALTCTDQPWTLAKVMNMTHFGYLFLKSDELIVLNTIARNPVGRLMTLRFIDDTWHAHHKRIYNLREILSRYIEAFAKYYTTEHELKLVQQFITPHVRRSSTLKKLKKAETTIKSNIHFYELMQDKYLLETWLTNQSISYNSSTNTSE